ncbi:MAG: LOG family protein [Anaerolineales bacterium]|nr:LOG family protein [Anaerolineales bacterium]
MSKVISIFGGAAPRPGSEVYEAARGLGAQLALAGWTVATGGYAGVMEAASRGAHEAGGHVIGVTCTLIENWRGLKANAWVREEQRFETLRERLYHLVEFSDAAVALPGGIGTLAEVALTWSLLQTGEIRAKPLVVVGRVWAETLTTFLHEGEGYLRPGDDRLVYRANDVAEAARYLGSGA